MVVVCGRTSQPISSHLAHGPVRLQEVWLEVRIKQVAADALNGIIDWQHMDALAILDIGALHRTQGGWRAGAATGAAVGGAAGRPANRLDPISTMQSH